MNRAEIYEIVKKAKNGLESEHFELQSTLEKVLKFMEKNLNELTSTSEGDNFVINSSSLFSFLLDLFILPKGKTLNFEVNPDLAFETEFLLKKLIGDTTSCIKAPVSSKGSTLTYSTLIVTENADLHVVADTIATAWKTNTEPWTIRDILIQENIQNQVLDLIQDRLSKFDHRDMCEMGPLALHLKKVNLEAFKKQNIQVISDRIAVGIQRNYVIDGLILAPIVTLNVFRTAKEGITLFNKFNGGMASIWSENISEALEMAKNVKAQNVWINCNGVFDQNCPFTIGNRIYGSELFHVCHVSHLEVESVDSIDGLEPIQKAFFSGNFMYSIIAEEKAKKVTVKGSTNLLDSEMKLLNFNYKTIVTRFGQTFAN